MRLKRWVAMLFLLLVAFYLGASQVHHCTEFPEEQGQVCHILCNDGCASAPLPTAPPSLPAEPLPKPVYKTTVVCPILNFDLEPEKAPPRA